MFRRVNILLAVAFAILLSGSLVSAQPARAPKVIIDTDFNTIFDDGQAAVMAAQLDAQGVIDLLGFTVASGNAWRDQEVADVDVHIIQAAEHGDVLCMDPQLLVRLAKGRLLQAGIGRVARPAGKRDLPAVVGDGRRPLAAAAEEE